ncbi:MAG: 5'-3' exonuclease H3TH domain-containing protein [Longimicrobiales bacterium]
MIVHLIDGTYELFRHFFGARRGNKGADVPYAAVLGVLGTVMQMIEGGAEHIGVATDHVIESFRNDLWSGYKTGEGIEYALWSQFHPLEDALRAMGVTVWPMIEVEADDALACAAAIAADDARVQKVCIWTPDKDLSQCVIGDRVVQVDRKSGFIRNADAVQAKFGVPPASIPDYLALVGDAADGFPGVPGFGARSAARLLMRYGHIADVPAPDTITGPEKTLAVRLHEHMDMATLFLELATLRTDLPVFDDVDDLRWRGPSPDFGAFMQAHAGDRGTVFAQRAAAPRIRGR